MEPREAAEVLRRSIREPEKPLTVADAATAGGLALRDAERGLQWLSSEHRGHLRVTEEGQLLYLFPYGFRKPWETRDRLARFGSAVWRGMAGVARFVVRAWILVVLVAYAALFLAMIIAMTFAGSSNDNRHRSSGGGAIAGSLFRALADAMFWTFHPWSPLYVGDPWSTPRVRRERRGDGTPFYEKVNRFFFGPTAPRVDPREDERKILAQIRAQKGRIGLADVMRVTGLPREQADPLMARLMLDYDGDVHVSEAGGIYYTFPELRKTALEVSATAPGPAWARSRALPPLTGNDAGANVAIVLLNGFNLIMSLVAIDAGMTVHRLTALFAGVPIEKIPYDGVPVALGLVPLFFSIALFFLPIGRALLRPIRARKVARENARLAVLREVLDRVAAHQEVPDEALSKAWQRAAGAPPASKELTREVVALGGDVELRDDGKVRYRFADLETEASALEEERAAADEAEAKVGKVIFASDA